MKKLLLSTAILACSLNLSAQSNLSPIGTFNTGVFDEGAAEIVAFDAKNQQVFFTNADTASIGILDVSNPSQPSLVKYLDIASYGSNANSVAIHGGLVAAAVENDNKQANGKVVFFDLSGNYLADFEVGALPDMITFSRDGKIVMTANEGEPNDEYTVDPNGSVSIIDLSKGLENTTQNDVTTLEFTNFTKQDLDQSTRIFGNNGTQSVAQDIEPEYVTIAPNNKTAFVACQENNAIAVIDLVNKTIKSVFGLGFKDHSIAGNGFDASNKSEGINITTHPVYGMPLPDAIKSFEIGGKTYIATANEGDSRDYDGYSEEERVKDLTLDATSFPNAPDLQLEENLGRLNITTTLGDTDNDGEYEELYAYGTRSFSIYDEEGNLVYDSGNEFETTIAELYPNNFNSTNDDNDSFKNRSDDKGPEPEAIEVAEIDGKFYAFIGMERMGGIFIYDITDPVSPTQLGYFLNRNFSADAESPEAGDLGVEDIKFVPASASPSGMDMLITANEISGTVTMFNLEINSSVIDIEAENTLSAYPNPTNGADITINKIGDYTLTDATGKIVKSFTNTNTLNINNIKKGVYVLSKSTGEKTTLVRQ